MEWQIQGYGVGMGNSFYKYSELIDYQRFIILHRKVRNENTGKRKITNIMAVNFLLSGIDGLFQRVLKLQFR